MISIVPASGGRPRIVPGTLGGVLPVFSPDGRSLAFTRIVRKGPHRFRWGTRWDFESASVWIVDLGTGQRRQLTRSRHNLDHYASSFSPDGTTLLTMRWDIERSQDLELVALRFDGRPSSLLVNEGAYPVYSPDGSKIALFRQHGWTAESSDLYVVDADGSHLRRLTHTPEQDELFASWDPSGERIAYSQFRPSKLWSYSSIMQVNADGTCPTRVTSEKGAIFIGPTWQPGPGREAGRIEC
jgi:Tol biopolymer transport system component